MFPVGGTHQKHYRSIIKNGFPGVPNSGGSEFGPDTVPNLKHWYIPLLTLLYQNSGMTLPVSSSGDPVGAWVDKIVPADELAQAVLAAKPTYRSSVVAYNNKPVVQFDGGDSLSGTFSASLSQPNTIFLVANGSGTFTDGDDVLTRHKIANVAGAWQINAGVLLTGGVSNTNPHIFVAQFDGASSRLWVDGVLILSGNAGTQALDGLVMGDSYAGASALTGYEAELLVYQAILSADEKNLVQNYLSTKYGISVTVF